MDKSCPLLHLTFATSTKPIQDEFPLPNLDILSTPLLDAKCFLSWIVAATIIRSNYTILDAKNYFQDSMANFHYNFILFILKKAIALIN